jgi:CTP:molybdopterin cytidylyltransferase MocA
VEHGPALVVLAAGRARRYGGAKPLAPVGPGGEAVIDLLASDARTAGFTTIILVVGPATGPAIRYHVARTWPSSVDVRFALQEAPTGTVPAVLSATGQLEAGAPFGVANADDLYGVAGLSQLASHLSGKGASNALVGYRLSHAVLGDAPVTRGICEVDGDGRLRSVVERRQVLAVDGGRFVATDGASPSELDGDALVSMNLWGFGPEMPAALAATMDEAGHASETGHSSEGGEVLLPDVVDGMLRGRRPGGITPSPFRMLPATGRCIGVTHPDDLTLVQAYLAAQVGRGERPALLWSAPERS